MRHITDHVVLGDASTQLVIEVKDNPGAGGACHHYAITDDANWLLQNFDCRIVFQTGGIAEHGVNGVTHEALLAIIIDRLRSFQAGPYPSDYNQAALGYCESALHALQARTQDRIARGVEGQTKA